MTLGRGPKAAGRAISAATMASFLPILATTRPRMASSSRDAVPLAALCMMTDNRGKRPAASLTCAMRVGFWISWI